MFEVISSLKLKKLFILAVLIRLLIMPFYFHPDIKTYHFQSSFLKHGVFNIYSYLAANKGNLPIKEDFVYFPLTYLFLGTYQIMVAPLLGSQFNVWLADASEQARETVGTFRYLFLLKIPYLLIDLLIPFLLIRFLESTEKKRKAVILWLFNPFSIVIIYIFSNLDIIPVALSLGSLLLLRSKKIILSGIMLGLAAGFKVYPMVFLPFLILHTKNLKQGIKLFLATVITLLLIILPFWSQAFLNSAFISGLTTRIVYPSIPIGFGEALMIGVITLTMLFILELMENNLSLDKLWLSIFFTLLLLFSTIHYHIAWLLWIMPFLILFYLTKENKVGKLAWVWFSLAMLIPLTFDDKFMTVSTLSVISPLYNLLPTPFLILQKIYDPFLLQGLIHSLMLGVSMALIIQSFKLFRT